MNTRLAAATRLMVQTTSCWHADPGFQCCPDAASLLRSPRWSEGIFGEAAPLNGKVILKAVAQSFTKRSAGHGVQYMIGVHADYNGN